MKKRKMMVPLAALCLLLAGCHPAAPESAEQTSAPTAVVHIMTPAPTEADPHILAEGEADGQIISCGLGGTEETVAWEVESWTVFDSWAAAGVTTQDLAYNAHMADILVPEPGGGVLVVDYTLTNESVEINHISEHPMESVVGIYPVAAGELEDIPTQELEMSGAMETVLDLSGIHYATADYFAQTRWREGGNVDRVYYFYFRLPEEGESVPLTVGYLLTAPQVRAAQKGELLLWFRDAGPDFPNDVSELVAVPLTPKKQ